MKTEVNAGLVWFTYGKSSGTPLICTYYVAYRQTLQHTVILAPLRRTKCVPHLLSCTLSYCSAKDVINSQGF